MQHAKKPKQENQPKKRYRKAEQYRSVKTLEIQFQKTSDRNQIDESNKTETKSLIRLALILTNYISWYSCKKLFTSRTGCITMI